MRLFYTALLMLLFLSNFLQAQSVRVFFLDGRSVDVTLMSISDDTIQIKETSGNILTEKLTAISSVEFQRALLEDAPSSVSLASPEKTYSDAAQISITLTDQSVLKASALKLENNQAVVSMDKSDEITIPLFQINNCVLQNITSSEIQLQWEKIQETETTQDILVVWKDSKLVYYRGWVTQVTAENIHFDSDGEIIPVKREKVFGFIIYPKSGTNTAYPSQECAAQLKNGSNFSLSTVKYENEKITCKTRFGKEYTFSVNELTRLDFSEGKIQYLSNITPQLMKWEPYFSLSRETPLPSHESRSTFFAPRMNLSLNGNAMRINGVTYSHGISLSSRTELVYRVPAGFSRFMATVGMDDEVRPNGDVLLVITADGKELFSQRIKGSEDPIPLDLSITGVKRITILVDYGAKLDISDHLDLGNARFLK